MSQFTKEAVVTFLASGAITRYGRVSLVAGSSGRPLEVKLAGPGDEWIGVAFEAAADAKPVGILMKGRYGTMPMIAAGAIAKGDKVFGAGSGGVQALSGGIGIGTAIDTATAEGDIVEVIPSLQDVFADKAGLFGLEDDFHWFTTAHLWTSVLTDSGTAAVSDGVGGLLALTCSDGSVADNDEAYAKGTTEVFKFALNKPIYLKAIIKLTEANTDDANWIIGLKDAVAANSILDDGGGPAASYSGMVFFKVDGTMKIFSEVSIGGTQVTLASASAPTFTSASTYVLEAFFMSTSSTAGIVYFFVNGSLIHSAAFTYTGATEMQACLGVKNGGANNEVLYVDYFGAWQVR